MLSAARAPSLAGTLSAAAASKPVHPIVGVTRPPGFAPRRGEPTLRVRVAGPDIRVTGAGACGRRPGGRGYNTR